MAKQRRRGRCGQAFANAAYGGLSSPIYGTLTVGRQTSLVTDGMGSYDPMALSPAFSLIGYSGTAGGGVGSTEATRWDNSVKYILTYGPFHAAGMYTNGGQDTPMVNDASARTSASPIWASPSMGSPPRKTAPLTSAASD